MEASINPTLYSSSLWSQLKCQEACYHFSAFLLKVEHTVSIISLAKGWKCELMVLHKKAENSLWEKRKVEQLLPFTFILA